MIRCHMVRGAFALALTVCMGHAGAQPGRGVSRPALDAHASGILLNASGDVLTARHAVANCDALFVVKDARVVPVHIKAASITQDLAVLATPIKPYLSATFPSDAALAARSQPVFADGYNALRRMPDRASVVFNAITAPATGELSLLSPAQPGASGSAVLGAGGLLLGMVTERVAVDGTSSGTVPLSRAGSTRSNTVAGRVKAVATADITAFLRAHDIAYTQSDAPQLGSLQAQAPRAATLSVGVICG
ncbi:serine protease [Pusillimonas sp. T7-7]|uniref:S1 family peptidase n=1 Tax=Pusillimonas sp. (strain T7-7) TaxID=1007105 RepID=UPI0011D1AE4B|nr:serine protease [Pusillimonas sp. T7-7]